MFIDRKEAGTMLAEKLSKYQDQHILVLGIPRGAMEIARIISHRINGELNALLVHKVPAPFNEEYAIGCVGLSGYSQLLDKNINISQETFDNLVQIEYELLKIKQKKFGIRPPTFKDRIVMIVDDGIATGATVRCGIAELKAAGAKSIIIATPVTSTEAYNQLSPLVDDFVTLIESNNMYAIGQFYENFPQVTDEEVEAILKESL